MRLRSHLSERMFNTISIQKRWLGGIIEDPETDPDICEYRSGDDCHTRACTGRAHHSEMGGDVSPQLVCRLQPE